MRCFSALLSVLIALSICPEARAEKPVAYDHGNVAHQNAPLQLGFEGANDRDPDRGAMERPMRQFGVYDPCMLKPWDTPCIRINVAYRRAGQSPAG
jgi:hypothetical protein